MYYCVELRWTFDSIRLAYTFEELGLTVYQVGLCFARIGGK